MVRNGEGQSSHVLVFCVNFYWKEFIYLFGVLRCFQHCTGHITTGIWKGRGNQYIEFPRVLYCKLPTNGKQLPSFYWQESIACISNVLTVTILMYPVYNTYVATLKGFYKTEITLVKNIAKVKFSLHF